MPGVTRSAIRILVPDPITVRHIAAPKRWSSTTSSPSDGKERVVILGSGWAGYALARTIKPSAASRIVISPRSHFVFTPLLASTAVGTLEFRAATEPVRRVKPSAFHQAYVRDVDFERKVVRVEPNTRDDLAARTDVLLAKAQSGASSGVSTFEVPYDKLVLAVGCYSQTFGVKGVSEHACFLRDIGDARIIRLKILQAFEKAALPTTSDEERKKLLHFAVVGGGPTGIEYAAELHDLIHEDLKRMYPNLMQFVAITIYDIAPKVLPMFDQKLAEYATDLFRRQGIQVKTEHHLLAIRREGDYLLLNIKESKEEIGAGVVVWSTGLMQNPLVQKITDQTIHGSRKIAKDSRTGGIVTDDCMRVQVVPADGGDKSVLPDVFAIGDCARVDSEDYPATAQVASQQAVYLGKQLNSGNLGSKPFSFRNLGAMAYLGSWRAIHQSSADELKGRAAWILWRMAYLTKSMSIRNKILIPVYWILTWVWGRDISRF